MDGAAPAAVEAGQISGSHRQSPLLSEVNGCGRAVSTARGRGAPGPQLAAPNLGVAAAQSNQCRPPPSLCTPYGAPSRHAVPSRDWLHRPLRRLASHLLLSAGAYEPQTGPRATGSAPLYPRRPLLRMHGARIRRLCFSTRALRETLTELIAPLRFSHAAPPAASRTCPCE